MTDGAKQAFGWIAVLAIGFAILQAHDKKVEADAYAAEDDAVATAHSEMADKTYQEEKGFMDCTEDCSGHEAGFAWAKTHEIDDDSDCHGDSDSFVKGFFDFA